MLISNKQRCTAPSLPAKNWKTENCDSPLLAPVVSSDLAQVSPSVHIFFLCCCVNHKSSGERCTQNDPGSTSSSCGLVRNNRSLLSPASSGNGHRRLNGKRNAMMTATPFIQPQNKILFVVLLLRQCHSFVSPYASTIAPPNWIHSSLSPLASLRMASVVDNAPSQATNDNGDYDFDLSTALLCGGLAFDAYVKPAANSSRWERGSGGLEVAYSSPSFTRALYKGLLEVTVSKVTGLPSTEAGTAERILSGGDGVDACVLVAVVEGSWGEDVKILEKEQFHEGVLDLAGSAHVSRSTTCWSSVTLDKAKASEKRNGKVLPYFVPASWGKGAAAVWQDEKPFYLYVQDPATARLVFTVLDDDRFGPGIAVGSTYKRLSDLIPEAGYESPSQLVEAMKNQVVDRLQRRGKADPASVQRMLSDPKKLAPKWVGELPLTSKPRKRDKNSQIMAAAATGAYLAGPAGAAVGAVLANFYEGQVQGRINMRLRYLPTSISKLPARKTYKVKGGLPGVNWGSLYTKYRNKNELTGVDDPLNDLEHCFFVSHEKTGATCVVYRSLARKQIIVSFRGTCAPVDLITDASLVQDAWVEGEDKTDQTIPKVHNGFRTSLNSIARRLKELILAVPDGADLGEFDMYITGHSLGGALATLFTADIAEFGMDAGRALPQSEPADPWWKSVSRVLGGGGEDIVSKDPPRPKSLHLYNFGSPRVGNMAFSELFERLESEGKINCAYRIVNGEDVVARLPRTVNGLVFGKINYDHIGKTVLIKAPVTEDAGEDGTQQSPEEAISLWIEGVSDDNNCPIRDGVSLSSPMAEGMLLKDLVEAASSGDSEELQSWTERITSVAGRVSERIKTVRPSDLVSVIGIEKTFTDREVKIFQSLLQGKAVGHHLEDQYYSGMGRASGFVVSAGEEIAEA